MECKLLLRAVLHDRASRKAAFQRPDDRFSAQYQLRCAETPTNASVLLEQNLADIYVILDARGQTPSVPMRENFLVLAQDSTCAPGGPSWSVLAKVLHELEVHSGLAQDARPCEYTLQTNLAIRSKDRDARGSWSWP